MEIIHTIEVRALVELQKTDAVMDAKRAIAAGVPVKIAALNAAFEKKKNSMSAAREALLALQVKKKDCELRIAEADEGIRKHQRELNLVKDNNAFKALLSEIENDKKNKDELETGVLCLLEEIDKASVQDKAIREEVKKLEETMRAEIAALEATAAEIAAGLEAAKTKRAAAAAALNPELLEKYEDIRANKNGLAVAAVHEDPSNGKFSCGGCHMSLTPQKTLDVKKIDAFAICPDCRRLLYLERTVYPELAQSAAPAEPPR
ncbi:MAG: C4-type zinc ribbon domain-containing protein [Elusimicrobiota bacterium]|nr:C4-type zinc ribbon domain-containing protein [Elusimicrobiota bacterium]